MALVRGCGWRWGLAWAAMATAVALWFQWVVVEDPHWTARPFPSVAPSLVLERRGPVMFAFGNDHDDLARALGYAHAKDRLVQMELQRLAAQGRLTECLDANPKLAVIDRYLRQLGFARDGREAVQRLSGEPRRFLEAYCEGVNTYIDSHSAAWQKPLEFVLVGHTPEPWRPEHSLMILKLMAFMGLAEVQGIFEKIIIQSIQAGASLSQLQKLFYPHLNSVDAEMLDLISRVRIEQLALPADVRFAPFLPTVKASNNWVVGPSKSATGKPLQCNDPHLEVNRLPAVWYEFVFKFANGRYWMGASVPGIPGPVMGRNNDISFGLTYGFMDQLDHFFEEVKDGKYRRQLQLTSEPEQLVDEWRPFKVREEVIRAKDGTQEVLEFYETEFGVLERKDNRKGAKLEDGLYLSSAWSWQAILPEDYESFIPPPTNIRTVQEAQKILRKTALSANFLIADKQGNIGYQQSGRLPRRNPTHSGMYPLMGWKPSHQWNGTTSPDLLRSFHNPSEGFIATANDFMQDPNPDAPLTMNLHMGPFRKERIAQILSADKKFTVSDMKELQLDLFSLEAELFMKLLKPILEKKQSLACEVLRKWDLKFDKKSLGAPLFSQFWNRLTAETFGKKIFGAAVWKHLRTETGLIGVYHWYFDRVLLHDVLPQGWVNDESRKHFGELANELFADEEGGRAGLFTRIVDELLVPMNTSELKTHAAAHSTILKNIFFDGALPLFLGFDVGPVPIEGHTSTVLQGSLFRMHGRDSAFCPSWRYVTDLGTDIVHTSLPGGPSGRRFSGMYANLGHYLGEYYTTNIRGK